MGNTNSTPSALTAHTHLSTHTSTYSFSVPIETHHSFSVSPFEHSTLISITKASSQGFPHGPSATHTEEYCSWDWERDTSSCTLYTFTVDTPTPFTFPTPTGRYGTSEASFSFPHYTCTDFLCIDSVASDYGFSLCLATTITDFGPPVETLSWPEESTTYELPTATLTCDPVLDWKDCPGPTIEPSDTFTVEWPTETSDYDGTGFSTTSSLSAENCEYGVDCWTHVHPTIRESRPTPSATTTTHSYSYRSTSISTSTRRTTTSTTTDCDFWSDDCTLSALGEHTTWEWDPDPWSGHTVSTTINKISHHSEDAKN
ncbi:hypothetical protein F5Y12DRAFT_792065 [Xylaria sp. FL1777]|nr:hypothetical protein F5Y12DRAFT_792065 [Xylaria sp. FL1777]